MLCTCSNQFKFDERGGISKSELRLETSSRELSAKLKEGEVQLRQGSIHDAEVSLREALSINNEEARALLGRLEYERGNFDGALQVFEGIQGHAFGASLRFFVADSRLRHSKGKLFRDGRDSALCTFLHGASLLLEAFYLKAKCLQELGRFSDAVRECKCVLDTMEMATPTGPPAVWGDTKMGEMVAKSVKLLPELLLECGRTTDAMAAYRRSLLRFSWCVTAWDRMHIMKHFAILLLYSGVEAPRASLGAHVEGSFTPKHNTEEAILLLMILLRMGNNKQQDGYLDPSILDHLSFALSVCGQLKALAHQFEELLPGMLSRPDRWYNLALCYCGSGDNTIALDLLRKALRESERPNHVGSLLLAAKVCAGRPELGSEGVGYAKRALQHAQRDLLSFRTCALHVLGVATRSRIQVAASDSEKARLHFEALEALQEAAALESEDPFIIFDLGLELAEQRQISLALECAKHFLNRSGGTRIYGWRFLALLLTSQERHGEAEAVLESALEETGPWEQGPLLRTRAKVQLGLGQPLRAVETYRLLLALLQAEQKNLETGSEMSKMLEEPVEEVVVWQDLALLYTELKQWRDAETCLQRAQSLKTYSATIWQNTGGVHARIISHCVGLLREAQGRPAEAMVCYQNALAVDTSHVDSKVKLGALLWQTGGKPSIPVARCYLAEALQAEPTHEEAWYQMGRLQKEEGCLREAVDSFQAAIVLEQSSPVEKFTSITPALLW